MSEPAHRVAGNILAPVHHLELARDPYPDLLSLVRLRLAPSEFIQSLQTSKVRFEVSVNACPIGVKGLNDRRPRPIPNHHLAAARSAQVEEIDASNCHKLPV